MGVAHFGSWAPNAQLYLKRYCKAKTSKASQLLTWTSQGKSVGFA